MGTVHGLRANAPQIYVGMTGGRKACALICAAEPAQRIALGLLRACLDTVGPGMHKQWVPPQLLLLHTSFLCTAAVYFKWHAICEVSRLRQLILV